MSNNFLNEQELHNLFEQDSKGFEPNQSVKSRLLYYFQVKSSSYKIRQNSFSGMFGWLFSMKNLPVKATMASLIIAFSMINIQENNPITGQSFIDSTAHDNNIYLDSAMLLPFSNDTVTINL
ncbi:MAG: hypothetical protein HQ541_07630 [Mariniphaga sp.]|nr:hypothetical protein [Mariniphaga sp.]